MPGDYYSSALSSSTSYGGDGGGGGGSGNWWDAPSSSVGSSWSGRPDVIDESPQTGRFNVNVMGPAGAVQSIQDNRNALDNLIAGLGEAFFGKTKGLVNGVGLFGRPLADAVRFTTTEMPVVSWLLGVPAGIAGGTYGTVENALSRIPTGWLPGGTDSLFDNLPDTPDKQAVAERANKDVLYGANLKYDYIQKFLEETGSGGVMPETFVPSGSLGGLLVQSVIGSLGLSGRQVERLVAGATGPNRMNRLTEIMALAKSDPSKLNDVEEKVAYNYGNENWSEDQALNYLTSHSAGYGHEWWSNLIGEVALDPMNLGSFGAAKLSKAGTLAKSLGEAGKLDEASTIGRLALAAQESKAGPFLKGVRTAVDPLSAFSTGTPSGMKIVDATSTIARERVMGMAVGFHGTQSFFKLIDNEAPDIAQAVRNHVAWGIDNNITREHIVSRGFDDILATRGQGELPEDVAGFSEALVKQNMKAMPNTMFQDLLTRATRIFERNVDRQDLANRMTSVFGQDQAHWMELIGKMDNAGLSLMHMATYNAADDSIMRLIPTIKQLPDTPEIKRLVIANPRHLDELGAGVLRNQINSATGIRQKFLAVKEAIGNYDGLAGLIRFKEDDMTGSVERALNRLQELIDQNDLYRVLRQEEIDKYPELKSWMETHKGWKLAFRPSDENLARVTYDADGNITAINPWVGHVVGDAPWLYQPGAVLPRNIAGMAGVLNGKPQAGLDWIDASIKTFRQGVSGANIKMNARVRFRSIAKDKFDLTQDEADTLITKIEDFAEQNSKTVRSLSGTDMWKAIGGSSRETSLIPLRLQIASASNGGTIMTHRDLMDLVLRAYEGDLRFVGLTQKFTGSMKTKMAKIPMLQEFAGGNFAGQFTEEFYPKIRFYYHPGFQGQEALEGWILNAQRLGVKSAYLRGPMSDSDKTLARIWENLVDKKVISMTDFDMVEQSNFARWGGKIGKQLEQLPNSAASLELDTVGGARSIARIKRINYLRQWGSTLGRNLREITGEDFWMTMKRHYEIADDNELAVRLLSEQMENTLGNQFTKASVAKYNKMIADGELWKPGDLGALKPLDLDHLAFVTDGYRSFDDLRQAIRSGKSSWATVEEQLAMRGAGPDYIRRAKLAIEFDEPQFWRNVRDTYKLTSEQFDNMRSAFRKAARIRKISPAEYLSGVVAPNIQKVDAAGLHAAQEIKDTVALLRAPKGVRKSQIDVLYTELAAAFRPHIDPSGLAVLRKASGVKGRWGKAHDKWLGEQMRAYVEGTASIADPDVARALQFMGKWVGESADDLARSNPALRSIVDGAKKLDTSSATPHNFTQELMWNSVVERMRALEQDAYRTHYFARTRTMFERSVNHPFFGLYPASYMWGKMLPEMIRFVAKEPFGLKTGGLAYSLNDAYNSVAAQRELDGDFDKMLDDLGRSPTVKLLEYMLPGVPWDLPAVMPQWMRAISDQGYQNLQRRQAGLPPVDIDPGKPVESIINYLNVYGADWNKLSGAAGEIKDFVIGDSRQQNLRGGPQVTVPIANTVIGGRNDNLKVPGEDQVQPVAAQLQEVVTSALDQLSKALSGR